MSFSLSKNVVLVSALTAGMMGVGAAYAQTVPASITNIRDAAETPTLNVWGISPDATVIFGQNSATFNAFVWSSSGGLVDLGTLDGYTSSLAYGISRDGSVVVGYVGGWPSPEHAFRWTQDGMVDLGTLGGAISKAYAVSADGSVVVGEADHSDGNRHAFRWTADTGMQSIQNLAGVRDSEAKAISGNGSAIAGVAYLTNGDNKAFRWTEATGMVDLGTLGGAYSEAEAISYDGSVVVGNSETTGGSYHAYRWTAATGMVDLGSLGGNSFANAVSGDGSVVVGSAAIEWLVYRPFRWTEETGMVDLNALLVDAGVEMGEIVLTTAEDISRGGEYILTFAGTTPYLVRYGEAAGLTTYADQQAATEKLSDNQHAAQIQSRAIAGELLGSTRPVNMKNHAHAGGMFGSAAGYLGLQYSARDVTVFGGFAYGSQEYPNITQHGAATVAMGGRYTFANLMDTKEGSLRPYVEIGGWVTPNASMTFRRPYANGSGVSTGVGKTNTTTWAGYGRGGLVWDIDALNQIVGYGELGRQYMHFGAYVEDTTATNPFPALVDNGVSHMNVARIGGSWTRDLSGILADLTENPVSTTLSAAAGRSFNVHSGLKATIAGIGTTAGSNKDQTWGEFGARIETTFENNVSAGLEVNGTVGDGAVNSAVHGGFVLGYKF